MAVLIGHCVTWLYLPVHRGLVVSFSARKEDNSFVVLLFLISKEKMFYGWDLTV